MERHETSDANMVHLRVKTEQSALSAVHREQRELRGANFATMYELIKAKHSQLVFIIICELSCSLSVLICVCTPRLS